MKKDVDIIKDGIEYNVYVINLNEQFSEKNKE